MKFPLFFQGAIRSSIFDNSDPEISTSSAASVTTGRVEHTAANVMTSHLAGKIDKYSRSISEASLLASSSGSAADLQLGKSESERLLTRDTFRKKT